ncbi:MAG: serine hydrolase [Patescibacteria group bacterium]
MLRSVLAVLLLGIVPVPLAPLEETAPSLVDLAIAPPAEIIEINQYLSASGVIILDMQSGQQIYGKQVQVERPMASLTKLMTALIIVENHDLEESVTVTRESQQIEGNNVYLPVGEKFTVGDLLSALLISSANDAAHLLATYHSGTVDAFVEEMNRRSQMLGMKSTNYSNPSGLDSVKQWSTPQDIAWLATFALRNKEIRSRLEKRGLSIYSNNGQKITLVHTHALMHADTSVVAGKTGTTDGAKQCLLSVVEINGKEYLVVLMHSQRRYIDMRAILDVLEEGEGEVSYLSPEKKPKNPKKPKSVSLDSLVSLVSLDSF